MISETLNLLAEDIAARQAQIVTEPPATDDVDDDPDRDTGAWTHNLGLADDVLDLAIALNDIARLTSRPRLAAWLDSLNIAEPASRRHTTGSTKLAQSGATVFIPRRDGGDADAKLMTAYQPLADAIYDTEAEHAQR